MNTWRSETVRPHGVWTSEIRLRTADTKRRGKVNRLLKRIEVRERVNEVKDAILP